jgi:fructose-1,6-bisphosphatase/inositol monophosphatase family enzyme
MQESISTLLLKESEIMANFKFDLAAQGEDLDAAIMIAYDAACDVITRSNIYGVFEKLTDSKSFDQVTDLDYQAQEAIIEILENYFPFSGILAEENEHSKASQDGLVFTIDPIDGTKEFVRGGNETSCMIGAVYEGQVVAALIGNPFTSEIFVLQARDQKVIRYRCSESPIEIELEFKYPPRKKALFSFEDVRDSAISALTNMSHPVSGYFKTHLVFTGSYGTGAMKTASNQVTGFITKANNINPWDEIPALGILSKLGYKYYIFDTQSKTFEVVEMVANLEKYNRGLTLVTHPIIFEELQQWLLINPL